MKWWRKIANKRQPDFIIGGESSPYLRRWWLIPRNKWFNVYLHEFLRSDDDRALHCHPWLNFSYLLEGEYIEHTIAAGGIHYAAHRKAGNWKFRFATSAHRIEVGKPCWTLFITGPVVREWGFHCVKGFRHWKEFVSDRDKGSIGRGCD